MGQCPAWLTKASGFYGFLFCTRTRNDVAREEFQVTSRGKEPCWPDKEIKGSGRSTGQCEGKSADLAMN